MQLYENVSAFVAYLKQLKWYPATQTDIPHGPILAAKSH